MADNITGNNISNDSSSMTIIREERSPYVRTINSKNSNLNPDKRFTKRTSDNNNEIFVSGGNLPQGISNVLRKQYQNED